MERLPPHSPDAEKAVIGCCLTTPIESIALAQETITSELFFYDARNQTLWRIIGSMKDSEVDVITVAQKLKDLNIAIPSEYLLACQDAVWSPANLPVWLEIIREKFTLRRLIATATDIVTECYGAKKVAEIMDAAEQKILAIRPQSHEFRDMSSLVLEAIDKIERKFKYGDAITGLTTGLCDLDKLTDGLHPAEMVVLAGYPATGKTVLSVNIAVTNALQGVPVAIFSAEMRPVQLVVRSICSESRVNFHYVNQHDFEKMTNSVDKLAKAPLYIEKANGYAIGQVAAIARRMRQRYGIKLAVIDYIQLLTGTGDNREQQISNISKGIKGIALELDIPVIALSQLNDDGKLRESRAIGQDADSVWKLSNDGEWQQTEQPIKLTVEKCRDGSTGFVPLMFLKPFTRFESASKGDEEDVPRKPFYNSD